MEYVTFVAERIISLRLTKGVSARDMSLTMGQNANYINHIENRKAEPSLTGLFYICEYFGITPHEFFDDDNLYPAHLKGFMIDVKLLRHTELQYLSGFITEIVRGRK